MSLPAAELTSVEFLLVAGRAVFLLFSFVVAAFAFNSWRRATQAQTDQVLSQTNTVLQRLAYLEARVDATKITLSQLGDRLERPAPPGRDQRRVSQLPDGHPTGQGRRLARGAHGRLRPVVSRGRVGATSARIFRFFRHFPRRLTDHRLP